MNMKTLMLSEKLNEIDVLLNSGHHASWKNALFDCSFLNYLELKNHPRHSDAWFLVYVACVARY